ncbi:MAG: VacJ family lipoprotein, partial [Halofilum sp. (in: g-proteobacteria)]
MFQASCSPIRRFAALLLTATLATGCASTRGPDGAPAEVAGTPGDPLEGINRPIHNFNQAFDRNVARPAAQGYQAITPEPVDRGVTNFFSNLDDVAVLVNSALQLKGRKAAATTLRLTLNTTFGVLGVFDVAGGLGIPKENEDFGQTLGYWGVGSGPYLVLPILGPSSLRDAPARAVDSAYWPLNDITASDEAFYAALLLYGIDMRASLLGATDML